MPDLDRTTLLKAIEIVLETACGRRGDELREAIVDALETLLPPAPSEAPAEAFTAQFTMEQIETAINDFERSGDNNPGYRQQIAAMLRGYLLLVRERHTGKG